MRRVKGLMTIDATEEGITIVRPTEDESTFDPNEPMWDVDATKYHASSTPAIRNLSTLVSSLRRAGYRDATAQESGKTVPLEFAIVCHTQTFTFNRKS